MVFNEVQTFLGIMIVWVFISLLNFYIIIKDRDLLSKSFKKVLIEIDALVVILILFPITNVILLLILIGNQLYKLILPSNTQRKYQEFIDEFEKKK